MVYLYSINLRFYHPSEKFPLNNLHHQFLSRSIDQLYLHSPDIEVCRCLSAVRCIFIPLPGPFADAIFYANVSFFCFFLGLQMQFDLPSKDNCILNLLILRLEDTFQRQKVSSILLFLNLKILSADKWYLQTRKITIADTVLRESTEIPSSFTALSTFDSSISSASASIPLRISTVFSNACRHVSLIA